MVLDVFVVILIFYQYEKPVSSKQVISVHSAHSSQGKRAVHINEIVLRSPLLSWSEVVLVPILEDYMRRMSKSRYSESYHHDVLTSECGQHQSLKDDGDGTCPFNRPPVYKMIERRKLKRDKKRNLTGEKGRGGIPIIIPAAKGISLFKEMQKVAKAVSQENPDIVFSIVEQEYF